MRHFGTTIQETFNALFPRTTIRRGETITTPEPNAKVHAILRLIATIALVALAFFLLKDDTNNQLGASIIGALIGYWLK